MNIEKAQAEARYQYLRGGTGAFVSGFVWLIAALVASYYGLNQGFIVLFFGGMLIFPLSTLVLKLIFKRTLLANGHPSGQIVIETVFPMIAMLVIAWLLIPIKPEWVFAVASIGVGTHYFGFRTAYGDFSYWVLGSVMTLVGLITIFFKQPKPELVPYIIAIIEIIFAIWVVALSIKKDKPV
ncbi:hypothetical protein [Kangiella sp. HZ709]|uniref:DUF7010 family protein n=1 Tax=Kangiella sp. HZ709 TaxID=2666328 RepID=UPI0012AF6389|nr:hypothetical protein [Kangiella sp. HZ709]MRX28156.1 hypothetical protein [Kangiella sp. HZ709]